MLRRIKWAPTAAVFAATIAVILGIFGLDTAITVPVSLLGVTLGLVSREN